MGKTFYRCIVLFVFAALAITMPGSHVPTAAALAQVFYASPAAIAGSTSCTMENPCPLQTAVDKAVNGDTVFLRYGEYIGTGKQVLLLSKSITVHGGWNGKSGPDRQIDPGEHAAVLNGEDARRVVMINNNASPILHGLIIRSGYAAQSDGGGVAIWNNTGGNVTIYWCRIQGNRADTYGGGVSIAKGTVTIQNSMVGVNTATLGGGLFAAVNGSSVVLVDNTISDNTAPIGSVGYLDQASILANANEITANQGDLFTVNVQTGQTVAFVNNMITMNDGAVVSMKTVSPGSISFLHNTLWANDDGVVTGANTGGTIANNIFYWHDESIRLGAGSTAVVSNNLFWDNVNDPVLGTLYVRADPKLDSNFHLKYGSPAIHAGRDVHVSTDLDGDRRPVGAPDIGADEFSIPVYIPTIRR